MVSLLWAKRGYWLANVHAGSGWASPWLAGLFTSFLLNADRIIPIISLTRK